VVDDVVGKILVDTATKVVEENEGSRDGALKALANFPVETESDMAAMELDENTTAVLSKDRDSDVEGEGYNLLVPSDGLDDVKIVEVALIPEVVQSPTRASPRVVGVAAEHTLVRAERMI